MVRIRDGGWIEDVGVDEFDVATLEVNLSIYFKLRVITSISF